MTTQNDDGSVEVMHYITDLGKPPLEFLPISWISLIISLRASKQARSIIHEAHCAMISRRRGSTS
jgi:hypothetical protein